MKKIFCWFFGIFAVLNLVIGIITMVTPEAPGSYVIERLGCGIVFAAICFVLRNNKKEKK